MFSLFIPHAKSLRAIWNVTKSCRRCLLSSSYQLADAWKERLTTPILQNISAAEFAVRLSEKFDQNENASAIDIDILANKLVQVEDEQMDYMQNIFSRFYKTRDYLKMTDSTPHAILRTLLESQDVPRLVTLLQEKKKYGLFLDDYTANLLLDNFIENKLYEEAAIVAYDQMFQEDFTHPLTKAMCWYACHLRWKSFTPDAIDYEPPDYADEDTFVRVDYIQNPYFDDHFDLPTEGLKLGKTFTMLTSGATDTVGRSYQLIGLGLHQKFNDGVSLLQDVLDTEDAALSSTAIETFISYLESTESREPPAEVEKGLARIQHLYPYITKEQQEELLDKAKKLHENLVIAEKTVNEDFEAVLLDNVKQAMAAHEADLVDSQREKYTAWIAEREALVNEQIQQVQLQQRKNELAERLERIQEKEERLQYFEQQDRIAKGVRLYKLKEKFDKKKQLEDQYVETQ